LEKPRQILIIIVLVLLALGALSACSLPGTRGPSDKTDVPSADDRGSEQTPGTRPGTEPSTGGEGKPPETEATSVAFVQKNTDGTDDGLKKLLSNMQKNGLAFYRRENGTEGLIGAKDVVLLKINCQWDERGGTNTDLLKSMIQSIVEHPDTFAGEIIVADNGQAQFGAKGNGGSLDWEKTNAKDRKQSAQDVVDYFAKQGFRVSGVLWDKFTRRQVSEYDTGDYKDGFVMESQKQSTGIQITYPKFTTRYKTMVSFKKGIWNDERKQYDSSALKVINVPVLKSHSIYQVTGAVKNYMGTTSDRLTGRGAHNSIGQGGIGTQMALTRIPALNILDAIWIAPGMGPRSPYSRAAETDTIAASTDPVALDYWASKTF
jgi:hypothetical protein